MTSCSGNGVPPSSRTRAGPSPRLTMRQLVATRGLECEVGDIEYGSRDLNVALIEQYAVLEGAVDVQRQVGTRFEI